MMSPVDIKQGGTGNTFKPKQGSGMSKYIGLIIIGILFLAVGYKVYGVKTTMHKKNVVFDAPIEKVIVDPETKLVVPPQERFRCIQNSKGIICKIQ